MTSPMPTATELVERFDAARELFTTEPQHPQIESGSMLAIGFLLGGSLPYAAGAVAILFERAYPDYPTPWGRTPP